MTQTPSTSTALSPSQYGVGARFTLSVYDSNYVEVILDALAAADASGLEIETGDISTFVGGGEQRILEFLCAVVARAAQSGAHLSASILLSRGCPGELQCELPQGVSALGAAPVQLDRTGIRARSHWSLYPLLDDGPGPGSDSDGGAAGDHMTPIMAAIERAKERGIYSGSDRFATRLDGDLSDVLETVANTWIDVGSSVQHVVTHLVVSINSPSQIAD